MSLQRCESMKGRPGLALLLDLAALAGDLLWLDYQER
jgi:hypothetical protein